MEHTIHSEDLRECVLSLSAHEYYEWRVSQVQRDLSEQNEETLKKEEKPLWNTQFTQKTCESVF